MSSTAQAPPSIAQPFDCDPITLRISPASDSPFERSFVNEKYTIGSSARCDLQLSQPGIQPLHCVLVKKPTGVQLTSWAAGVLLNGNPIQTATLEVGSVITVGEFKIVWEDVTKANSVEIRVADYPESHEADSELERDSHPIDWGTTADEETAEVEWPVPSAPNQETFQRAAFSDWLVYQTTIEKQTNRARCKQLLKSCRDSRENATRLGDQIDQLEKRLAEVSQERLAQQGEVEQLAAETNASSLEAIQRAEELETELTAIRQELADTRSELSTQTSLHEKTLAEYDQLRVERDELAASITDQSISQDAVSESLAERDRQLEEVRAELARTRNELTIAEEQLHYQTERYDHLESELNKRCEELSILTDRLAAATEGNQEADELSERCNLLQSALDSAEKRLTDLSQLNLERDGELNELRKASELWSQEKAQWQEQQLSSQEALAALTKQLEEAKGRDDEEIAGIKRERDQLQEELASVKTSLEEFTSSADEREAQIATLEAQQNDWQAERNRLESELSEKSKAVLELKNDLEEMGSSTSDTNDEIFAERDRLAEELAKANQSLVELRELSVQQQEELEKLTKQAAEVSQDATAGVSEEQFAEVASRLESLATELEASRTQCGEAEKRAEELQVLLEEATEQLRVQASNIDTPDLTAPKVSETDSYEETSDQNYEQSLEEEEPLASQVSGSHSEAPNPAEKEDFFAAKPQPKSEGGPTSTSFIEQYSHLLEEDGNADVEPAPERTSPLTEEHSPAETIPGDEDEDEALQAYMANMMSRVRGDGPVPAPTAPVSPQPVPQKKEEDTTQEEEYVPPTDPIGLDELRQTTKKAPLTSDLAALRDLANSSARNAIAKSSKRRHFEMAISKLIICGISLPTAGYLMYAAKSFTGVMFLGGAVAAVAGLYSGVQLLGCLLRAIRDGSWEGADNTSTSGNRDIELPIAGEELKQA